MPPRRKSTVPHIDGDEKYNRRLTSIRMGAKTPSMSTEDATAIAQELEKTEQSITLALQDIDRNVSRAVRLISEDLLPILEDYSKNSQEIMNQGGFWKDFLERSVNVKFETYEEDATVPLEEFDADASEIKLEDETLSRTFDGDDKKLTEHKHPTTLFDSDDENVAARSPVDLFASTPKKSPSKLPVSSLSRGTFLQSEQNLPFKSPVRLFNGAKRPLHTPAKRFNVQNDEKSIEKKTIAGEHFNHTPRTGILRHQVVDKNWKIQATPRQNKKKKTTFADEKTSDDDLDISPEYPRLRSDIFNTDRGIKESKDISSQLMTPENFRTKIARHAATPRNGKNPYLYEDTDSSIDFMQGISPPVTLQFGGTASQGESSAKKKVPD